MASPLNVIALISGGKDSVFSLLHCIANGHNVIALANLYPPLPESGVSQDLNSYMYQTVGHTLLPLFSTTLSRPLYRQQILGSAINRERDYQHMELSTQLLDAQPTNSKEEDETESMISLLRRIMLDHPTANALCSGAVLSTYQRTRVESVTVRLGLIPLSFLWQYPSLPTPIPGPAGLLDDMAAVGLDARLIKVASGGLREDVLWGSVTLDEKVRTKVERGLGRFDGSVLGEGGEYETIVVGGGEAWWKGRIEVGEAARCLVSGEGGEAWLEFHDGQVLDDNKGSKNTGVPRIKIPELLDERFTNLLRYLTRVDLPAKEVESRSNLGKTDYQWEMTTSTSKSMNFLKFNNITAPGTAWTAQAQMEDISQTLLKVLHEHKRSVQDVIFTTILLRSMADFAAVNSIYGKLFTKPNPPARLTVACGNALPQEVQLCVSCVVDNGPQNSRQGLHVQSRSYWAPANIGPYSQAISKSFGEVDGLGLVHVAGQIPLIPATMEKVIAKSTDKDQDEFSGFRKQACLALQHLWRIGTATHVNWWTGAIAFITGESNARTKAIIAWKAWEKLHELPEVSEQEKDSPGLDIWDMKHSGPKSFAVGEEKQKCLPDFQKLCHSTIGQKFVPPFFAVQMDELPRGCDIEWHSVGIRNGTMELRASSVDDISAQGCRLYETRAAFWHLSIPFSVMDQDHFDRKLEALTRGVYTIKDDEETEDWSSHATIYTSRGYLFAGSRVQIVPCRGVWGPNGEQLAAGIVVQVEQT